MCRTSVFCRSLLHCNWVLEIKWFIILISLWCYCSCCSDPHLIDFSLYLLFIVGISRDNFNFLFHFSSMCRVLFSKGTMCLCVRVMLFPCSLVLPNTSFCLLVQHFYFFSICLGGFLVTTGDADQQPCWVIMLEVSYFLTLVLHLGSKPLLEKRKWSSSKWLSPCTHKTYPHNVSLWSLCICICFLLMTKSFTIHDSLRFTV